MDSGNTEHDRSRDSRGRFATEPETADFDAQAATLRRDGLSYRQIGERLGVHHSTAADAVRRAMQAVRREPAQELITIELERLTADLERLNRLRDAATATLELRHTAIEADPDADPAPMLAIIDRLVKIDEAKRRNSESRRKLLGLDQPIKVNATVTDEITAEINRLADELEQLAEIKHQQDAARKRG